MLRALMGGGRSSSDLRASTSSSSGKKKKSSSSSSTSSSTSRRRKTDSSSKSSKPSSSRGDDSDRGLGDLSAYPSSSSGRHCTGESVASSSRYRDGDDRDSRSARRRRDRSPTRELESEPEPEPEPEPIPRALEEEEDSDDHESDRRQKRRRTQPGDPGYLPPLATGALPTTTDQFAADIASPGFSQFPMQHDNNPNFNNNPGPVPPSMMPGHQDSPVSPATFDPHVPQQFPGQFPAYTAEPYRPTNPAGEAADYYGDQGQSVQDQPGVRPTAPAIIPNSHAHLMPASPMANPPEEPSSMGQVGAAADYYGDDDGPEVNGQTPQVPTLKPPKPSKPSKLSNPTAVPDTPDGIPSGLATHGSSESSFVPPLASGTADPQSATFPPDSPPHSHNIGPAIGVAAAGAAAGYMANHHHQSSSSPEHPLPSPYTMQNNEPYTPNGLDQPSPTMFPPYPNPALNGGYAAHPMHPHHQAIYHSSQFQSGSLAFQQRQRNPLDKFVDFWRDPEGAGEFEDYTEAIGICKHCFEPGTTSRDAPRKHNYRPRRRSSDRYSNGSRVDKSARYSSSSDDESRRRSGSSKKSWLGGLLSGYAVKSILDNKDFEDSYNVRPSRVSSPHVASSDSESDSDRKTRTSRGTYKRSPRSRSPARTDRSSYSDSKRNRYDGRRRSHSRSRSRSRSPDRHSAVRDAALGAAVGTAMSQSKSVRSPKRTKDRKSSSDSSSSSYLDIGQPSRKSVGDGLGSFFTSSSENRKKRKPRRRNSMFSLHNSSSSSLDADLAFGSGYAKKPTKPKKGKGKDQGEDVDAKLLGLNAAATALAASSHGQGRRPGDVLAGRDSRPRRADHTSSATNDEDWEDLDPDDESSSASSALAFGGSGIYGNSEDSSDSGTSKWNWRWGSKKDKKKKDSFPTGPVLAGAAALGTAALASGYRKDGKDSGSSSSSESLKRVVPIPTSDPSRFDAATTQPAFVRPGPIPLQQPQPVTPVSQAIYTSQGESIPAYSAPADPPFFGAPVPRHDGGWGQRDDVYPERSGSHRRRDSSPVYDPEPLQGSTISSFKRHSGPRDNASSVQFNLTQEQADKERRADRRERRKRDSGGDQGIQLFDQEYEEEASRRERRRRERRRSDYDDSSYSRFSTSRRDSPDRERRRDDEREKDTPSWVGPAAVGTIGAAAAAATVMSRRSSEDASERREKRRAERRRTSSDRGSETSSHGRVEPTPVHIEDVNRMDNQPNPDTGKSSPSQSPREKPVYDDYATFFAPEGLRYSPDSHGQRRDHVSMPTIVEAEPVTGPYAPAMSQAPEPPYPQYGGLPWPVPQLNLIEPTPPHSQNGSVRDIASPIPPPVAPSYREFPRPERPATGSQVSWGDHQIHEYEVPSTSSEHESVDHDAPRKVPREVSAKNAPTGNDIEFAAALAAGAAFAGFDPKVVTDNPTYHTRSSPPESGLDRRGGLDLDAPWEGPALRQPHGFVEGEVETPGADGKESSAPDYISRNQRDSSDIEHQRSLAREALEQPNQDSLFREIPWKEEPASRDADVFSMPGGFDSVEPVEKQNDEPKPRSVVSEGGAKEKKRRNKKRSSRGSANFDDSGSVTSSPAWISDERQGKSQREERRREGDSAGEVRDWGNEKDLNANVQFPNAGVFGRPLSPDVFDSRPRSRSISPCASAKTVDPDTKFQSRPSSLDERGRTDGNISRRSSSFHESPTAVPLHFRYPGASPVLTQRSPSGGSPGAGVPAQSPGSPTQKRQRPTSSEFKHSREMRPLWLVERHGNQQPEDEPLPPLPASTVSSRNPSLEDPQDVDPDEKSWEMVDLSRDVLPDGNPGLDISVPLQKRGAAEEYYNGDIPDSQQATPTKPAFEQEQVEHPSSVEKKGKPKYEFHSPSELLRDPSTHVEFSASPKLAALPFTEGSAVGVGVNDNHDREIFPQGVENIPIQDSRPSTPQDKQIPAFEEETRAPRQDTTSTSTSDVLKGAGFAGVVGAAVAAAVDAGDHEHGLEKPKSLTPIDENEKPPAEAAPVDIEVNRAVIPDFHVTAPTPAMDQTETGIVPTLPDVEVPVEATTSDKGEEKGSRDTGTGFGAIVDAAVRETMGSMDGKLAGAGEGQTRELDSQTDIPAVDEDKALEEKKLETSIPPVVEEPVLEPVDKEVDQILESTDKGVETAQPEETPADPVTSESSSKKKKKNKKNKKNKSVDLATDEQPPSTPAPASADEEVAGVPSVSQEGSGVGQGPDNLPERGQVAEQESVPAPVEEPTVEDTPVPRQEEKPTSAPELEPTSPAPAPEVEHAPEDTIRGLGIDMAPAADVEPSPTAPKLEPTSAAPEADHVEAVETGRELEPETTAADTAEPSKTTSSKKAKRDKKKKSKGGASEDQTDIPAPSDVGTTEGEIPRSTERPPNSEVEPEAQPEESKPSEENVLPATDEPQQTPPPVPVEAEERAQVPQEPVPEPTPSPEHVEPGAEPEASKGLSEPTDEPPMTTAPAEPTDAEGSPEMTEAARELDVPHEQGAAEPASVDNKPEIEGEAGIAPTEPEPAIETTESAVPQERSLDVIQDDATVPEQQVSEPALDTETKKPEPEAPTEDVPNSTPVGTTPEAEGQGEGARKPEEQLTEQGQTAEVPAEPETVTAEAETPRNEPMPTDTVEVPSEPAERNTQAAPADPESEGLSRKNSKKNKKKNKGKSATVTPTEQEQAAIEELQPQEVPSMEAEAPVTGEQSQDTKPEGPQQTEEVPSMEIEAPVASDEPSLDQKPEEIQQLPKEEPQDLSKDDQPALEPTVEPTIETPVATEEAQEEPTKEKKKNKKNRKSAALSEPEPASEPAPEPASESVDTAETHQTSGEVPTSDDHQTPATSGEPASVQDVESAPATTESESDLLVEKSEANDGSPHVSAQPNVEFESAPERESASTPTNEQQEEKKDGVSTTPEEAVPDLSSNTDDNDASAKVDIDAPASEEPSSTQEPSKEDEQPIEKEMPRDITIDVPEGQGAVEEDVPMTPAQKKKSKKEKKKKRQSVSEPADATVQQEGGLPVSDAVPAEESPVTQEAEKENGSANEEPAAAAAATDAEPTQEQPKGNATADVEPAAVSEEPAAAEDKAPPKDDGAVEPEASVTAKTEDPVTETEPTQETAGDVANVEPAVTNDEPSVTETKPTEEPQGDATVGVEPAATDLVQEVPKDDAVGVDADVLAADQTATDAEPEKTAEDHAADVAPTQDEVQDLTTESAQEPETTPENDNASLGKSLEEVQDPGPSSSAKSKKNKKKNRQSASLDDEQPTPPESEPTTPTTPATESPSEAAPISEDTPAVPDDAEKSAQIPPAEPVAEEAKPDEISVTETEPVVDEPNPDETPVTEAEPTEEPLTAAAKKKAKKDKKKRKSVTFETEQPPGQPDESVESEPAQPADSTEPTEPATGDEAAQIVEQKPDSSDVSAEQSPTAPDSASTDGFQIDDTPLDTPVEPTAPKLEDHSKPEELEKEAPSGEAAKDEPAVPQGAEPVEEKEETKSDADTDALSSAPQPEVTPAAAETEKPAESESQTPITEGEQEPGSAKSKKNKKKKKKGKASEVNEEAASEPSNDVQAESEKALDVGTAEPKEIESTEPKELEAATPESKEPESMEPMPETPEVKEAQAPEPQSETPEQDTSGLSAKAKKKAKKAQRQSKNLDNNDAATGPSLETATAPAEDYGKEHQSRDTENDAASIDKDLFWTDQIVSSQVEQQEQATPSDYPSKLNSENVEDDTPAPVSSEDQAFEAGESPETDNALPAVNEPETSGAVGTNADNGLPAEVSEERGNGNEDDGAGMAPVQDEGVENKDALVAEGAGDHASTDEVAEKTVEVVNEDEQTAIEAPVTGVEGVPEGLSSEEPPAPNEEDSSPLVSGKKKKKDKKKKQKQQDDVQVEESQAVEPSTNDAEPESSEHQTIPEAEQPVEVEGTPSTEKPTRGLPVSTEEPTNPTPEETETATEPAELSKDTTSQPEEFEAAVPSNKMSKKDKKKNKKSLAQETDTQRQPEDAPISVPSNETPTNVEPIESTDPASVETESDKKDIDEAVDTTQDAERSMEVPSGETPDDTTVGEPTPESTPLVGSQESPGQTNEDAKVEYEGMTKGIERGELPSTEEKSERSPEMNEPAPTTEPPADIDAGEPIDKSVSEDVPPSEEPLEESSLQLPEANEEEAPFEIPEEKGEETVEAGENESATEPLSRKESKKKKKKAKKQTKEEEQEEPATPAPVEEVVPDVGSENAKESITILPEESAVNEQVDAALGTLEADVPVEPTSEEQKPATDDQNNEPKAEVQKKEAQDKLQGQTEKEIDHGASRDIVDPLKEPETAPLSRKLSKKEKRKAKQKAAEENVEPATEEPAPSQSSPTIDKGSEARNEVQEDLAGKRDFNTQVTNPCKHITKSQAQETGPQRMKTHQLAQDDDSWPEIDFTYNSADTRRQNSLPSPETRPTQASPLDPAIGEFDEAAVPDGVASTSEDDKAEKPQQDETRPEPGNGGIERSVEAVNQPQPGNVPGPMQTDEKSKEESDMPPRPLSRVASIFPDLKRAAFRRPASKESLKDRSSQESLKDRAEEETMDQAVSRENVTQVSEAPITLPSQMQEGSRELPATSTVEEPSFERSTTTESETPVTPVDLAIDGGESKRALDNEIPLYAPSPLHDRSSALVNSSPVREATGRDASPSCELRRSPSIVHGRHEPTPRSWSLEEDPSPHPPRTPSPSRSLAGETSSPRTPLHTIAEQEPEDRAGRGTMDSSRGTPRLEMKPEHVLPRPETPTPVRKFTDNALARQTWPTEKGHGDDDEIIKNPKSRPSSQALEKGLPAELPKTPEQGKPILRPSSVNSAKSIPSLQNSPSVSRSLRRATRTTNRSTSGDLRAASRALEDDPQPPPSPPPPPSDLNVERIASSSSYDPVTDKGKRPVRGMTDVYEAWGETPNSPRSPSRPPSVRHRRSMQHLQDVETRLDSLISENRLLIAARDAAEDKLRSTSVARRKSDNALNRSDADLRDREAELEQLQDSVEWHQKEVARLTEENDGLSTTNANITAAHAQEIQAARESSAHQLEDLRSQYQQVTADMQDRVRREVDLALAQKNADLRRLREELESARDKVKRLQEEIATSVHNDVLSFRDEDFFDAACQKLCGHVQQWVLRFSKHSDHRRCRKLGDLHDEKLADRFDNAILDGSDVDAYLGDRVRRRDVFMSVVMTMVWEFVFTRYLFGMDREQRQKLKSLEKQLGEVGPRSAVHHWRATTLSLLSKRPSFTKQRENDTEAVALEIFNTLARLLPPPTQVENQLLESLRKVLRVAVTLSVEMRSQLAEYIMLPPLQPEYNTNGDLARFVSFNASLMNERSGETTSNEELEKKQLPVRIVLFPLVVKKGNDKGEGEDEVVVCPAQVLVARPAKDKHVSQTLSSDRMSLDANRSVHSVAPSSNMDMSNLI